MWRFLHKLPWFLAGLLALAVLWVGLPAAAQESAAQVTLFSLYTGEFPQITAYLDVHDATGNFVPGLATGALQVLEDNTPLPVDSLEELRPGVQLVVAVAPGASFDIRDGYGVSRYDYLRQGIYTWKAAPQSQDDYSLVTPWGSEIAHVDEPERILAGLSSYQPLGEQIYPDLQILSRALELAANPTPRPGMERAILLITAPQAAESVIGLQSLAARATELDIRIYIWVIAPPEFFDQPDSAPLRAVSGQTGGRFFAFSGSETVPGLEDILEPLRSVYQIHYTSRLTTSGSHQAAVQVSLAEGQVSSNAQTFEVTLLAPQPVFISPPSLIQRAVPTEGGAGQADATAIELLPVDQLIEVMINFPDDYVRPLVRSTLYVDGMIAAENTAPPFDQFTWDLRGYFESGKHVLKVEALDSLGLSGMSVEMPVQVNVTTPELNILAALLRNKLLIAGMAVTLAGAVLALVLILGGKIRPAHPAQPRRSGAGSGKSTTSRPRRTDPVSQPVPIAPIPPTSEPRKDKTDRRPPSSPRKPPSQAPAYLIPLAEAGTETLPALAALEGERVMLGSERSQVDVLLADASVEAVHVILLWEAGSYRLIDNESVAGTWVNYAPVGPQGVLLAHGDLIYAGRVGFRFTLRDPGKQPRPVVRLYEEPGK